MTYHMAHRAIDSSTPYFCGTTHTADYRRIGSAPASRRAQPRAGLGTRIRPKLLDGILPSRLEKDGALAGNEFPSSKVGQKKDQIEQHPRDLPDHGRRINAKTAEVRMKK